jgi:DNA-binding transcriptional MerR regulator
VKTYSTREVARKCGIHPITLHRWVQQRKIRGPRKQRVGGVVVRLWTERDVKRVREYKARGYWQGGGRKPKG